MESRRDSSWKRQEMTGDSYYGEFSEDNSVYLEVTTL